MHSEIADRIGKICEMQMAVKNLEFKIQFAHTNQLHEFRPEREKEIEFFEAELAVKRKELRDFRGF